MRAVVVLLLLFFAQAVSGLDTDKLAPLLNQDNPQIVPGEYIVVFKSGVSSAQIATHIQDLVNDFRLSSGTNEMLYGVFNIGKMHGFSAKLSVDMLARERTNPDIEYIECNGIVTVVQDQCIDQNNVLWNLDRISEILLDLDGHYYYHSSAGQGVNAYVIDTGIQINHVDFEGRASWGFAIDRQNVDGNGHGTHVASTLGGRQYGVAKKVTLIAVKVLNSNGSGTLAGVIAGVDYVTNAHQSGTRPSVANMSLGGGRSAALTNAVENSIAAGVTYAVAAGNDNANACNYSPADAPNALTVGATTSQDIRSTFSNYGTCVDIFAPGTTITAAWIGSNTAIRTISGTSMASPHVAGAAAIVLGRNPTLTPDQVGTTITSGATNNVLRNVGAGSPNLLLYSSC